MTSSVFPFDGRGFQSLTRLRSVSIERKGGFLLCSEKLYRVCLFVDVLFSCSVYTPHVKSKRLQSVTRYMHAAVKLFF